MKKVIPVLLCLVIFQSGVFSQDQKLFMIGGNVLIDYQYLTNQDNSGSAIVQILPKFGFMTKPKLITGFGVGFSYYKENGQDAKAYSLLAFARYHDPIAGNFRYFIEPAIATILVPDSDFRNYIISSDVGIMYVISSSLTIEFKILSFNFNSSWRKGHENKTNELYLEYELITPNIGIWFFF